MTLYQFSTLTNDEKALQVWEGKFMLSRQDKGHQVMLYKLDSFYVEVYYHLQSNEIIRFNPFSSVKRLELYFQEQLN